MGVDARGTLKLGIALSLLGVLLSLGGSLLNDRQEGGLDDLLFPVANIATLFGLLALILAVYALVAPPTMPTIVLAGAALFTLGRLGSVVLGAALPPGSFRDPAVGLAFAVLGLVSAAGTIVLLYGLFQVVRDRLGSGAPRAVTPAVAPTRATPQATQATQAAPRRSAFRPPQAPLPPAKTPGTHAQKPR